MARDTARARAMSVACGSQSATLLAWAGRCERRAALSRWAPHAPWPRLPHTARTEPLSHRCWTRLLLVSATKKLVPSGRAARPKGELSWPVGHGEASQEPPSAACGAAAAGRRPLCRQPPGIVLSERAGM